MRIPSMTFQRDRSPVRDQLATLGLSIVLVFFGMIQFGKVLTALRDGQQLLALHQGLMAASSIIMGGLLLIRRPAVAKGAGWRPKAVATTGSFATLPLAALPLMWQPDWLLALTSAVLILSYAWIIWALLTLRRSFSVFPEARELISHGPYAWVRHPLYAAYFLTYACAVIPRIGIWAIAISIVGISAEVMRSRNEEHVLRSAFPEYESYARRVPAFFPFTAGISAHGKRPRLQTAQADARSS